MCIKFSLTFLLILILLSMWLAISTSYLVIWDPVRHLKNPNILVSILSENIEDRLEQSLTLAYILLPLLVTLIIYFRSRLGELSRLRLLEGSEVYCH